MLAIFNSCLRSSLSIASFEIGTEFFCFFLGGGAAACATGNEAEAGADGGANTGGRDWEHTGGRIKDGGNDGLGNAARRLGWTEKEGCGEVNAAWDVKPVTDIGFEGGNPGAGGKLLAVTIQSSSSSLSSSKLVMSAAFPFLGRDLERGGRDKGAATCVDVQFMEENVVLSTLDVPHECDFQQEVLWKYLQQVGHGIGQLLPEKDFEQPPQILLRLLLALMLLGSDWLLVWRLRIALLMFWMWVEEALPRSLNIGSSTFSANQIVAIEESGS